MVFAIAGQRFHAHLVAPRRAPSTGIPFGARNHNCCHSQHLMITSLCWWSHAMIYKKIIKQFTKRNNLWVSNVKNWQCCYMNCICDMYYSSFHLNFDENTNWQRYYMDFICDMIYSSIYFNLEIKTKLTADEWNQMKNIQEKMNHPIITGQISILSNLSNDMSDCFGFKIKRTTWTHKSKNKTLKMLFP